MHKSLFKKHDKHFPLRKTGETLNDLPTPWISKAMIKSLKEKLKLYIKILKSKNSEDELIFKNQKSLFKKLRKEYKQNYCSNLLEKDKDTAKQRWQALKEIARKFQKKISQLHLKRKTELYLIKMLLLGNSILFLSKFGLSNTTSNQNVPSKFFPR